MAFPRSMSGEPTAESRLDYSRRPIVGEIVELVGKVVVVTGRGNGIGRAVPPKQASRLIYGQGESLRSSP